MPTRSIPWPRILAEGAAIVVSILLAFGIQAWWEERQLRLGVVQDLGNVAQEAAANREQVHWQLRTMERMAQGGAALVEVLEAADPSANLTRVTDTLAWLGQAVPPTLDPSLGALDALVASGRLGFVEDEALRLGLSGLRSRIEDAQEGQQRLNDLFDSYLMPLMYESYDNRAVDAVGRRFWTAERVPGVPLVSEEVTPFPNGRPMRNFLRLRVTLLTGQVREVRGVLEELDRLSEMMRPD